jgi:acyl-CoA synthetase (NDP forming)
MNKTAPVTRGQPYSHGDLRRLIAPSSIAIIGASETIGSFGANTIANLRGKFSGALYPVNPKRTLVFGERCYPAVTSLPENIDCAVVIVPASQVEQALKECSQHGIGSAIVYSSGFAELGTREAIAAQEAVAHLARSQDIRVIGPNCIGIANVGLRLGLTFMPSFEDLPLKPGPVGIVTQSGALGYMLLQAMRRGVGFSHWLTTGNACDVDVADLVNYLVDDEGTRAIACSFEGLANPDRFLIAARRALAAGKPLVVFKVGQTEASKAAALSHTGSLIGSAAAYRAALESVGAVVVEDFEAIVETANFLAKAGPPEAAGAAVITMSGGAGIMALDIAHDAAVNMPPPADETKRRLADIVPAFGSANNPADLTGESIRTPSMYGDVLHAFADDSRYGSIVVIMASGGYGQMAAERARMIEEAARQTAKPVAVVWMNEWLEGPGSEIYDSSDVLSSFRSLRRCMQAIAAWQQYHARRPALIERSLPATEGRTARPRLRLASQGALTERQSKEYIAAYGVQVTREELSTSAEEAVAIASLIGYPVVLKAESADIPHKSDAGVVILNLADGDAVRSAWQQIETAVSRIAGQPRFAGIIVQQMIGAGVEVIVGARYDEQFGPLVSCGIGGIAVEVLRDVAVALAPVSEDQALEMIRSLKGFRLLTGFRGSPPMDVGALAKIVSRISSFAYDYGDSVREIDVNPVILRADGATAVDALIVTGPPEN